MATADVPAALQERLGAEATGGLVALLEAARQEWVADVTTAAVERFERRLGDDLAAVRVAMARSETGLRLEMSTMRDELRNELRQLEGQLTQQIRAVDARITQTDTRLETQIHKLDASIRQAMGDLRFDLLKWCFVFWMGQVVAIVGIVGLVIRVTR